MALYSALRLLIFFGFVCALWLLGLRDESQRWWLLVLSALGSAALSYFVLRVPRAQLSARIAHRVDERSLRRERSHHDEIDEDVEAGEDSTRT